MKPKTTPNATMAIAQPPRDAQQFTEIIKLAREALEYGRKDDQCLWRIGDKLVDVCGRPGRPGVNNGSGDKMRAVADKLKKEGLGIRFSLPYLRKLRKTAYAFPAVKRLTAVQWSVHDLAGDPDTLTKMLENAESDKKRLTAPVAKKQIAQRKLEKKVKALKDGKDDADTALRDFIDMAKTAQKDASKLCELAKDAGELIAPHLPKLTQRDDLIDAITLARDEATKAVTAWDQLLRKVSAVHHATHH